MKNIILLAALSLFGSTLFSQISIDSVLSQVEKNNTALSAFRKNTDAEKLGNQTGIYLNNPELGVNYLLGNPDGIGNRTDFSLIQSFDFPTAYAYKNQLSNLMNEQAELEYLKLQKSVMLRTRLLCIDLVYLHARKLELDKRKANAEQLALSYEKQFKLGDVNILEYNKAQVNYLNVVNEAETNEIERMALLTELAGLNGGVFIEFTDTVFPETTLIPDFETWYGQQEQNNPFLLELNQEVSISQKQEKLNSALSLPTIEAGYMSESVVGEKFQGITMGVSIPLWENKNTVKYAKAKTMALQSMEADACLQYHNQMKTHHAKAVSMQQSVNAFRKSLLAYSNVELLQKALEKGQISLAEYILELTVFYQSVDTLLEKERELNKTWALLNQFME